MFIVKLSYVVDIMHRIIKLPDAGYRISVKNIIGYPVSGRISEKTILRVR